MLQPIPAQRVITHHVAGPVGRVAGQWRRRAERQTWPARPEQKVAVGPLELIACRAGGAVAFDTIAFGTFVPVLQPPFFGLPSLQVRSRFAPRLCRRWKNGDGHHGQCNQQSKLHGIHPM